MLRNAQGKLIDTSVDFKRLARTLLWLMFVILPLSLIVLPSFFPHPHDHEKSYEASLKANLHLLRNSIELFKADTGVFPAQLDDLVAQDDSHLKVHILKGMKYLGPYLSP